MGRTRRKRHNKVARSFYACDHEEELISLNSWLFKQGLRCNKKLGLAVFDDTGRGVITKMKISPGEELMNMPLDLTINVTTLLTDTVFTDIFVHNKQDCFLEYKEKLSFQSLLAFYLVYQRIQKLDSKWYVYLKSLPEEYTVPYHLPDTVKQHLDAGILAIVTKQTEIINSSYDIFKEILGNCTSNNEFVKELSQHFMKAEYEWAYFTVNTRCVFMDLTRVLDLRNSQYTLISLLKDNTKIALCPYLDMINHSPKARNETKLFLSKDTESVCIHNIRKELFSDVTFSIYTKNIFEPYTQVFICYGDSFNLKLITEYGFFLPSNELDYVLFEFDTLVNYWKENGEKLSQEQMTFINNHGLKKDLYIDTKGFSFNLYALLMVVKYYYKENIDVSRVIYSSMDLSSNSSLNELIVPLVREKIVNVKNSVSELKKFSLDVVSLHNCVELMCQYVRILQKFIEC